MLQYDVTHQMLRLGYVSGQEDFLDFTKEREQERDDTMDAVEIGLGGGRVSARGRGGGRGEMPAGRLLASGMGKEEMIADFVLFLR